MSNNKEVTSESTARVLFGIVKSCKMHKTIVVLVERRIRHPRYQKTIKRSTKIHVHDPENKCQIGDHVLIQECRPISKMKRWKLVEIKQRAE
jgi:small subunit ribosomal protein S17